ncbi:MAG TPA: FdhF/YdeP family oxidoreductase [Steroidobacteraceae bacterium]|nr:FdhF/YdeP family oxidoreductase [Steroidobacteraceae bacterium]
MSAQPPSSGLPSSPVPQPSTAVPQRDGDTPQEERAARDAHGAPPPDQLHFEPYEAPSGGWGSVNSVRHSLLHEHVPFSGSRVLMRQNKPDGFACVSCAWAKPADPHVFEFCENGAKATTWEITSKRVTREFFAEHAVSELAGWDDHHLEAAGRLTEPMRYDSVSDKYVPISWQDAFQNIGASLRALDPSSAVFYSSGRASLEAAFLYALFARAYGHNNLPDSSNMCHESTSVALPESIGVPVGTVTLDDFKHTDCIFFFGQNVATSSPRMLHDLQDAARRGVPIITFNPLRERGLERFANPQSPGELLSGDSTRISSQYHQVRAGGDTAAMLGIAKALFALDDGLAAPAHPAAAAGLAAPGPGIAGAALDHAFIAEHTHGFEAFRAHVHRIGWEQIEQCSGLTRNALEASAAVYARSQATIFIYGMGLTQHKKGVQTVQTLVDLALLRGSIGKPGAGICPVRGHSNVQGQRTVGITEKPALVPVDKLREHFGVQTPPDKGMNTVEACEAILQGRVRAFLMLGGNFVRAIPDRARMEAAWRRLPLTVQVLTKLNRSAIVHGEVSYILPCLGRTELDEQPGGPQDVSVEDSTGCMHGSRGRVTPAAADLRSEVRIVAELAKATLAPRPGLPWDDWANDYAKIRNAIALAYPDIFHDFNARMWQPGGFHRPIAARQRQWQTSTGKANFIVPSSLSTDIDTPAEQRDVLQLITLRSNGQFNTTVYDYHDRFRGVEGTRLVLFMNRNDIERLGLAEGQQVIVSCAVGEDAQRELPGLRIVAYNIPDGCVAGYYPECNVLIPLWHHAERSKVPAAKSIPVRVRAERVRPEPTAAPSTN